jgi:REP-associated tyrosine transposase
MALSIENTAAEALRHVVAQGRGRRLLYRDPERRSAIAGQLAASCLRHRLKCLVWCITDRRLHVVLRGKPASITLATHELIGSRMRHGHWLSTIVNRDVYLLEVIRHVLLGPVRAGLCRQAAEWPFSSARESLGLRPAPAWMDLAAIYELLGPRDSMSINRLRRFMENG